jgi:hypothetical protein
MSFILIWLSLSILGWGTGYKLSLYYPASSNAHLMPHAKLLSKNEQDSASNKIQDRSIGKAPENKPVATFTFFAFVCALYVAVLLRDAVFSQRDRETGRDWHRRQRTSMNFFFVLPPPVSA